MCQDTPSTDPEGQDQRTMPHNVAEHLDFFYFWEILIFSKNVTLLHYNTTLKTRATPPESLFRETIAYKDQYKENQK